MFHFQPRLVTTSDNANRDERPVLNKDRLKARIGAVTEFPADSRIIFSVLSKTLLSSDPFE